MNTRIIELAQLSCIWTEVLQIINLMLSCRGVGSPTRRAPLRGERSWRRAAASQNNLMLSCRGVGSPARRAPLRGERHWRGATAAQKHRDMMCAQYLQNIMIEYLIFN